ncbi:MAG: TolC family outer membrane protein [Pseudomonadota bacterium]
MSNAGVAAQTLEEALAQTYQSNPVLEAQRAALRQVDENVFQANSGYLPNLSGTGSIDRTQTDFTVESVTTPEGTTDGGDELSFPATNTALSASVNQPIFRGFRTKNSVKRAKADVLAGRANLATVEQDVLLQTVTTYVNVLRDQAVLKLNDNLIAVLRRQLEASQDRFRVGEITRTDVAQSQARLADAVSRRAAAAADLTASQEQYRRVVGDLPVNLVEPKTPDLPIDVTAATQTAFERAPIILAARYNEEAAQSSVKEAKGGLLPSVNGFARISRNTGVQVLGPAITADNTRVVSTVGAEVTVPFFQSGAEYSAVRQAKQLRSQRILEIRAAERQVVEQVTTAWEVYQASLAQIKANEESVNANNIALEGVRQEAAVGSRTTLDVLDAEQEALDAQVNLVRAKRDQTVAAYSLLASMGQLTARQLDLAVKIYDPEEHADKVDWKFFGFGD